jgi:hypothetical protein
MSVLSLPLVRKELREALRARAALIIENLYLLALACTAAVWLYLSSRVGEPSWVCGRGAFWGIAKVQAMLLGLVAAALAAATITTEREQKTEDILLSSPAHVRQIVRSKLTAMAALLFTFLLLSLPVTVICLYLGGLTWQEVALAYLITAVWLLLALAVGLLSGALFRRTIAAVPLAIVATFLWDMMGMAWADAGGGWPHGAFSGTGGLVLAQQGIPLKFFGLNLPLALVAILLCLPLAACLTESALDRVRLPHRSRPVQQRVWLALSVLLVSAVTLGRLAVERAPAYGSPWDNLLMSLTFHGGILIVAAVIFSSQGFGKRDLASLGGRYLSFTDGLFGSGPRAGARFVMALSLIILGGWGISWMASDAPLARPAWRVALALGCLLFGIWVACLLSQLVAFWRLLKREWLRRTIAALLVALAFGLPPALAAWLWRGHEVPPPASVALFLTNPIAGCLFSFDPLQGAGGSPFAAHLNDLYPLGGYTLAFMLALGALLCLALWRLRLRHQRALAARAESPSPDLSTSV